MNKRIRGLLTSDPLFYSIGLATILLEAIPGRRFLHTKKQEERPLAFPPVHKRSGIDFFLEHTAFLGGIIVGVAGLFVFLLGPDFLGHRRPCGGVIVALGAQMIHAFGGLHVGGVGAAFFHHFAQHLRIFQHGAGAQMVAVKGLFPVISHEQGAFEHSSSV